MSDCNECSTYTKRAGTETTVVTPDQPEVNGLIGNFLKAIRKIWHIAKLERKHPKQEIYKYLHREQITAYTSTGLPPAEVLFGQKYHTRLMEKKEREHEPQLRQHNEEAKAKQKYYKMPKVMSSPTTSYQ